MGLRQTPPAPDTAVGAGRAAEADARIVLGEIVGAHGVRGEVKIHSWTRPRQNILNYPAWLLDSADGATEYRVTGGRAQGRGLVAGLAGVDGRDSAEALQGRRIMVARRALPPTAPGEYYWADLEGLAVETLDGASLGRVSGLLETGANDVLVVSGERERLIPYTPGLHIQSVEPSAGRIRVDWDPEF